MTAIRSITTPAATDTLLAWNPLDLLQRLRTGTEKQPVSRLPEVERTLQGHSLRGSFEAHLKTQLTDGGRIKIGVVDDFSDRATHGRGVEARILATAPDYLRGRIDIVRYDVAGLTGAGRAAVFQQAADDAGSKKIVALSLSGGLDAVSVADIERGLGAELDRSNVARAYNASQARPGRSAEERRAWESIRTASRVVPVVTPIWNDGNTTPAVLALSSGNGIVTSIDDVNDSNNATESSLVDHYTDTVGNSTYSSQSAPIFIGQSLGVLSKDEVDAAVARRR